MDLQDLIAIGSFLIAIMGVVYAFGKSDQRLTTVEKDLNGTSQRFYGEVDKVGKVLERHDHRLDELAKFYVRLDQRTEHLEEKIIGAESSARLRKMDVDHVRDYNSVDEKYYSENSGIEM